MAPTGPVFIVGLPRSGSTLLSRWVNGSEDVAAFNDLYYVQAVLAHDALDGPLDDSRMARLVDTLATVLRRYADDDGRLAATVTLEPHRIEAIQREVVERHRASPLDWAGLMDETLTRAARAVGKARWADKTPQNFLHVDLLRRAFPSARFVYLVRDPRRVLASYKHARGPGQDRRRYHPVPYALYWRTMARSCLDQSTRADVAVLRYEEVVGAPALTASTLGAFLGTGLPALDPDRLATNSSFRSGPTRSLTSSEEWLCERLCGAEMAALGYRKSLGRPRLAEAPELMALTARFALFQARRATTSPDGRKRIAAVASRAIRA